MTTAASTPAIAPTRPFTARLLGVLQLFTGCRGHVALHARTLSGIAAEDLVVPEPVAALPFPLLDRLREGYGVRMAVATKDGTGSLDLGAAFVVWRPRTRFDAESDWRHQVVPDAAAAIAAALASFAPPPACLIDGAREVIGLWPLTRPLPVHRDPARALLLLARLAERLGGDPASAKDSSGTVSVAGVIRNWNNSDPDRVEILDVAAGATYPIDALEQALEPEGGRR